MNESEKKCDHEEEDDAPSAPAWMTTYGDLMTLLMTFFILIMSFSTMEVEKFKMAMGSLKGAFGILGLTDKTRPEQSWFLSPQSITQTMQAQSILEHIRNLRELIKQQNLEEYVDIYLDDAQVLIQIKDQILFDSGEAELRPDFLKILSTIARGLVAQAREIKVDGHTDDLPIKTQKYPSNWELSFDRALSVVRYFVMQEGIPPGKLSAAGFGEYHPIVANNSPKNRAKNRRVLLNVKW